MYTSLVTIYGFAYDGNRYSILLYLIYIPMTTEFYIYTACSLASAIIMTILMVVLYVIFNHIGNNDNEIEDNKSSCDAVTKE